MKKYIYLFSVAILFVGLNSCKIFKKKEKKPVPHRKPVVYIYNNNPDTLSVNLKYQGKVTSTYPKLNGDWRVVANSDGKLTDVKSGREYSYLYYEGLPSKMNFEIDKGFVVAKGDVEIFMQKKLDEIGLNYRESNDMISYWLPELTRDNYVAIKFSFNEECDKYSSLEISPKPESEFRVMIEFKSLDESIKIEPQTIQKLDRKPFTVVEWGGVNLTTSGDDGV